MVDVIGGQTLDSDMYFVSARTQMSQKNKVYVGSYEQQR